MTLLLFLLILSVLIFVHELGHFMAAKKAGILVEEFGFGLPPRLWGKKVGETVYSINALPIGGFVKLYGEDGSEKITNEQIPSSKLKGRAYFEKSLGRRFSVIIAGVMMNLLLAIVCFSALYFHFGIPVKTDKIKIVGISENSPAQAAQIKPDDQIVSIDGEKVAGADSFVELMKERAGAVVHLGIVRGEETLEISVIPRENPPAGDGPLGVAVSDMEIKKFPWWQMPYYGVREGFKESLAWGGMILSFLKNTLVTLVTTGKAPRDIAGPVGIYQITGQAAKGGIFAIIEFLGILSVNLMIINVLPIPAMDGGRLIFLGYEAIVRKKANQKLEMLVNNLGMVFLLGLMLLITVNDILRLFNR